MGSSRINRRRRTNRARGFSLLEMMMVVAITLVMVSVTFISMQPVLKQQRVGNAYNTVLSAMRQARDNAIAQRTSYKVTLDATTTPHTVKVEPMFAGFQGALRTVTYKFPDDVYFDNEPGIPTSNTKTPDNFGNGGRAIDFGYTAKGDPGTESILYFCPDGTAQNSLAVNGLCQGNWSNGVVYIARRGDAYSSRAVTVWGATGRIRGWRLERNGGGTWQRQ